MTKLTSMMKPSATDMIRADHTRVLALFHRYDVKGSPRSKQLIAEAICMALEIHAAIEEEIFYPAMQAVAGDREVVDKSYPEHAEMKALIARLRELSPESPEYDNTFLEMMRDVLHHVADEESILLPDAERKLGDQVESLGARMMKRRMQLHATRMKEVAAISVRSHPAMYTFIALGAVLGASMLSGRGQRQSAPRLR